MNRTLGPASSGMTRFPSTNEEQDYAIKLAATFTASGPVRGSCGHAHRSQEAAERCAQNDAAACRRQGGGAYSDRKAVQS
jgi:hypothetical protein